MTSVSMGGDKIIEWANEAENVKGKEIIAFFGKEQQSIADAIKAFAEEAHPAQDTQRFSKMKDKDVYLMDASSFSSIDVNEFAPTSFLKLVLNRAKSIRVVLCYNECDLGTQNIVGLATSVNNLLSRLAPTDGGLEQLKKSTVLMITNPHDCEDPDQAVRDKLEKMRRPLLKGRIKRIYDDFLTNSPVAYTERKKDDIKRVLSEIEAITEPSTVFKVTYSGYAQSKLTQIITETAFTGLIQHTMLKSRKEEQINEKSKLLNVCLELSDYSDQKDIKAVKTFEEKNGNIS